MLTFREHGAIHSQSQVCERKSRCADDPGLTLGFGALRRAHPPTQSRTQAMKVVNSIKTMKKRDKNSRVVRRRGRVYVINKKNPRFKARQG